MEIIFNGIIFNEIMRNIIYSNHSKFINQNNEISK